MVESLELLLHQLFLALTLVYLRGRIRIVVLSRERGREQPSYHKLPFLCFGER